MCCAENISRQGGIQVASCFFCSAARENLNNVRFQGKTMRVSTSKHDRISMPKKDGEVCALKEDVCKY